MTSKTKQISAPPDATAGGAATLGPDFKDSLVGTLQESNSARQEIKKLLLDLLRDPDVSGEVKNIVDKVDRDSVRVILKRFGAILWSVFVFILGIVVTAFVNRLSAK